MTDPAILDEIQARHLASYKEFAAMTMSLARKAHARAETQLDEPAPPAPNARAFSNAKDEALRYTRLARLAHQSMRDEARAALGLYPAAATSYRSPAASDPRYALIRRTLHQAVRHDPDAPRLRRGIDLELGHEITADPDQTRHPSDIFITIAQRIQIPIEPAQVPDELLPDDPDPDPRHPENLIADDPPPQTTKPEQTQPKQPAPRPQP